MRSFCIFAKNSNYGENKSKGLYRTGWQVAVQLRGEETCEREFGNLKLIKDNYPKFVVTMDPNVGLIHDSGIVACSAREFFIKMLGG